MVTARLIRTNSVVKYWIASLALGELVRLPISVWLETVLTSQYLVHFLLNFLWNVLVIRLLHFDAIILPSFELSLAIPFERTHQFIFCSLRRSNFKKFTWRVVESCLLLRVMTPCKATGCCGISIFTAPIDSKPLFLSLPRLETLEYNIWLLPTVTFTTVCWFGAVPSNNTIIARPNWPVCEHSKAIGFVFFRHVALLCKADISASS